MDPGPGLAQGTEEEGPSDGSLELSFTVADFSEIAMEILKHGSGVKVIRPAVSEARIRQEAEKIISLYNR